MPYVHCHRLGLSWPAACLNWLIPFDDISRSVNAHSPFFPFCSAIHARMYVLLSLCSFNHSASSFSRLAFVAEITSIRNGWRGGRFFSARCFATRGERKFNHRVGILTQRGGRGIYRKGNNSLASAPLNVSLLTTNAWIFGSHPVGPYTSIMGTIDGVIVGLKNLIKASTREDRSVKDSRYWGLDLRTSSASSGWH